MAKTIKLNIEKRKGGFIVITNDGEELLSTSTFSEAAKFVNNFKKAKSTDKYLEF